MNIEDLSPGIAKKSQEGRVLLKDMIEEFCNVAGFKVVCTILRAHASESGLYSDRYNANPSAATAIDALKTYGAMSYVNACGVDVADGMIMREGIPERLKPVHGQYFKESAAADQSMAECFELFKYLVQVAGTMEILNIVNAASSQATKLYEIAESRPKCHLSRFAFIKAFAFYVMLQELTLKGAQMGLDKLNGGAA